MSGCARKCLDWILSVFLYFDDRLMTFEPFFGYFSFFLPFFFTLFDPNRGYIGPFWDHFENKIVPLGEGGLQRFWVDPGSLRDHLGMILASFWVVLVSFCPHF